MTHDANSLVSMPVLDTSTGTQVGRVKDVLFDLEDQIVYGLLLQAPDGELILPRDGVGGIGSDAITVAGGSSARPVAMDDQAQEIMGSGIRLRGTRVMTEQGDDVGTLDRIILDDECAVAAYEVSSGFLGLGGRNSIAPTQVRAFGADAIVISPEEETQTPARHDDASVRTPPGTDPNKETVVSVPDSQPGNLVEDELKERVG